MKCAVRAGSLQGKHLSGQLWGDGLFKLEKRKHLLEEVNLKLLWKVKMEGKNERHLESQSRW